MRERLGLADVHNIELNKRLEESIATVQSVTLVLPATGETSQLRRCVWRFGEKERKMTEMELAAAIVAIT